MESIRLMLALILPAAFGALCVASVLRPGEPGRRAAVAGYGALLGLLLVPLLLRMLDALAIPLGFTVPCVALAALMAVVVAAGRRPGRGRAVVPPAGASVGALSGSEKALFLLLLSLIALRFVSIGLELVWRPLFPWDATMHWATKARVWFDAREIVPFVENQRWLELGGDGVFTDHHPAYPVTIPLLQVWINLALGYWNDSLMNLPWLVCLAGLAAAFYGQARMAGSTALAAMVFTYFLVSMPLVDTHVALAGYADLFLGACYCAALMAFHNWTENRQPAQALLALVFALFCPLIKNEGLYWLLTFVPALAAVQLTTRRMLMLSLAGLLVLAAVLLLLPADLVVAGHSLASLKIYFRPGSVAGLATSFWLQDNWHLLGYLLLVLPVIMLFAIPARFAGVKGIAVALLSAVALLLVLFLFTKYSGGAVRYTAVTRISLQLTPGLLFFCLLMWNRVSRWTPAGKSVGVGAVGNG